MAMRMILTSLMSFLAKKQKASRSFYQKCCNTPLKNTTIKLCLKMVTVIEKSSNLTKSRKPLVRECV